MKFIKLNQRYALGKRGFKYAFLFKDYSSDRYKIEQIVRQAEGFEWYTNTSYGKRAPGQSKPYYVGFNNESTATLVMLSTQ